MSAKTKPFAALVYSTLSLLWIRFQ
jgi:hypothetical protein